MVAPTFTITKVPQYFKIITLLRDILSLTNIQIKPTGIYGNTLTDSKVGLIEFFIPKESMEDYHCEAVNIIGINLGSYYTILKCIGNKVPKIKHMLSDDGASLQITSKNKRTSNISMCLMELDSDTLDPETEFETVVNMKSKELYDVIKDLSELGDTITISIKDNSITFSTDDTAVASTSITFDDADIETESEVSMKFSIKELLKYTKAHTFAENVSLYFAPELPLTLHYLTDDNFGWFRMFLAPQTL